MASAICQSAYMVLTSPPIYDHLYEYCSPRTLLRIARTCKGADEATKEYLSHTFSIRYAAQLRRFFPEAGDVLCFRQLQADLEFLVFGSQAQQLLDCTLYSTSDLNLYVRLDHASAVADWLTARGYHFVPEIHRPSRSTYVQTLAEMFADDYHPPSDHRVELNFKMHRASTSVGSLRVRNSWEEASVQIVVVRDSPLRTILKFHATRKMNFVSWDRVVSLYPKAIFGRRAVFFKYGIFFDIDDAMERSTRRVSRIQISSPTSSLVGMSFPHGGRWVGDGKTWTVKLSTSDIKPPKSKLHWEPEIADQVLRKNILYSYSGFAVTKSGGFEVTYETLASSKLLNFHATSAFLAFLQPQPTVLCISDHRGLSMPPRAFVVHPHLQKLAELVKH